MRASLLHSPAKIETNPLDFTDVPDPVPQGDQVLVRVGVCGVCRTDLHVVDGELPAPKVPIIPGHEIVGRIDRIGVGVEGIATARTARRGRRLHRRRRRIGGRR